VKLHEILADPTAVAVRRCRYRGTVRASRAPVSMYPATISLRRLGVDYDWHPVNLAYEDLGDDWEVWSGPGAEERRAA
jgi:hypothetical protein